MRASGVAYRRRFCIVENFLVSQFTLQSRRPTVMGILNTTPDSFSDGGELFRASHLDLDLTLRRVERMVCDGVDIVDVGGESTRPGATPVSTEQELDRVIPVLDALRARFDVPVSVDTSTPEVMKAAAAAGAAMINDVRALRREGAIQAAVNSGLYICLMHMLAEPGVMQQDPQYHHVVDEVQRFLAERVEICRRAGICQEKLIIDPGFGFGKTLAHNLALFRALPQFVAQGLPVMVGVSRKTMVGAVLTQNSQAVPVNERVTGSVAFALLAVQNGAAIVRVHDVKQTVDALKVLKAVAGVWSNTPTRGK